MILAEVDSADHPLLRSFAVESLSASFGYRDGQLHCEEVSLVSLSDQVGTPCYVYSREGIVRQFQRLQESFSRTRPRICYAVKANSNLSVLKLLKDLGASFDIVSAGELHRLKLIGAPHDSIIFSGTGKTVAELKEALELGILAINVESLAELIMLGELSGDHSEVRVSLRFNPDIDVPTHPYIATGLRGGKFGVDTELKGEIHQILKQFDRLKLVGVGSHIGSQIIQVEPFVQALGKIRKLADDFTGLGHAIEWIDLGGGIGIPYREEPPFPLELYAETVERERGPYEVVLEPGRFLVGAAGVLLTRVVLRKQNHERKIIIVDAGMNDFMRPSLYSAYHQIVPVRGREVGSPAELVDVAGPVCESGDFFARDRALPQLQAGELLAIMNAGAYGSAISSNYNSRPLVPEVMVEGNSFRIIRRREDLDGLTRLEEVPTLEWQSQL